MNKETRVQGNNVDRNKEARVQWSNGAMEQWSKEAASSVRVPGEVF